MKMKAALLILAATACGLFYLQVNAQTPAAPGATPGTKLAYPYGQECIVTVDPQANQNIPISAQREASGFHTDGTLRGELIYVSDEWCVLKDGTFENWIPREKVLSMRVSR